MSLMMLINLFFVLFSGSACGRKGAFKVPAYVHCYSPLPEIGEEVVEYLSNAGVLVDTTYDLDPPTPSQSGKRTT